MKMCKVKAEIIDDVGDGYVVEIDTDYGTFRIDVSKSAVTDIREEVDWSKVKVGTSVLDEGTTKSWFFIKCEGCRVEVGRSYEDAIGGVSRMAIHIAKAKLLTGWLKEHGNKEES